MTWTGLPAQTLLWALVAGVLVLLILFFIRPRPLVLAVSSHVLWKQVVPKRLDPLIKEIIALLLQLLILAAVVAALGAPQRAAEDPEVIDIGGVKRPLDRVVVVDLSASMAAADGEGSRLDSVRGRLQAILDDLAEGERMALVVAAQVATVTVPLTGDRQRIGLGIRSLAVRPGRADLQAAIAEAGVLAAAARTPAEIRVFSDEPVPPIEPPEGCVLVLEPVGSPRPNVAVTAFDVRATDGLPAKLSAFVRVTSFAPTAARVTVSIETPTKVLGRATYDLPPWESLDRVYHFYPPDEERVEVVLDPIELEEGDDALATDDRAFAFLPELRPARVLLVTRGNQYLQTALNLIPGLKLDVVTPVEYRRPVAASGRYDVVFYDSFVPDSPPRVNSFFVNPQVAVSGFSLARRVEAPTTTGWNLGHPLFANLVLRDLNVAVSGQFEAGKRDVRLIDTPTGPIALAREHGGARQVVFGFDFADSDLPLRVAFPQMIFNTVLWMRENRATRPPAGPQLLARDPLWLAPDQGAQELVVEPLVDGDTARRRVRPIPLGDGPWRYHFDRVGFFTISGATDPDVVAVSMMDPWESDLTGTPVLGVPPGSPPAPPLQEERTPLAPPWFWLGLAALLLLLGEYGIVNR